MQVEAIFDPLWHGRNSNDSTERVKYLIFHNTNWNFKPRLAFDGTAHIRTCMDGIMCLCFMFSSLAVAISLQQIQTTKHIQHIQNNESNKLFGSSKDRSKLLKKNIYKIKPKFVNQSIKSKLNYPISINIWIFIFFATREKKIAIEIFHQKSIYGVQHLISCSY